MPVPALHSLPADWEEIKWLHPYLEWYETESLSLFRIIAARAKSDGSAVTELDLRASATILKLLSEKRPSDGVICEEEPEAISPNAKWQWIIDPLDGTACFSRGYPVWGVGIGLSQHQHANQGFMHFPASQETCVSLPDRSWFNGQPVLPLSDKPSQTLNDLRNILIDSTLYQACTQRKMGNLGKLRCFGSNLYHMMSTALGRAEAMICTRVYHWDMAAALPLAHQQGLTLCHVDGSDFDELNLFSTPDRRLPQPLVIGKPTEVAKIIELWNA